MHSPNSLIRLIVITTCIFAVGVSCTHAEEEKKSPATSPSDMSTMNPHMMNPMMMGQMGGMMNPHMYLNMMAQMSGQFPGMMNPMMMNGGMMNPMMGMNMMYPMMGMMGPMMGPMSGGMGMPSMGASNGSNPMAQMPMGQMMDPKQYEQWFNQWTEMMKNMTPQPQASQ